MSFIIIYITCPDQKEAERIAGTLMKERLAACANIFPIKSSYWWKGTIENSGEVVCLVKSRKENWKRIESAVRKIHPYELPCIMKIDVEANKEYEEWIRKESSQNQGSQ